MLLHAFASLHCSMLLLKRKPAEKPQQLMDKKPWASWAVYTSDVLPQDKPTKSSFSPSDPHHRTSIYRHQVVSGMFSGILSGICDSIWDIFWHSVRHIFRQSVWHISCHSIWHAFFHSMSKSAGIPQSKYAKRTRGATFVSQFSVFSLGL